MTRALLKGGGLLLLLVATGAGCASMQAKEPTLYERFRAVDGTGTPRQGRDAIAVVVGHFVANVVADGRVNVRFKSLKPAEVFKFKSNLSDQICQATGGPCSYLGKSMKESHTGMKITDAEWNATVEALVKALDKHKVPAKEKSELLAILGPLKGDIVGQ